MAVSVHHTLNIHLRASLHLGVSSLSSGKYNGAVGWSTAFWA